MPRAGRAVAAELGEGAGLGRGRWGCRAMVWGMTLHRGGCTGVPQPGGLVWVGSCCPVSLGQCLALLAAKLSSPCAGIPALHSNPCLALLPSAAVPKPCFLPGNSGGYCADLALSEKQILIIYVQLV